MGRFILTICISLAVLRTTLLGNEEPPKKSSSIIVEGHRLRFNPKTCTQGQGGFGWGNGSASVTILGHQEGKCIFDYQWEVEGAGSYQVHRVKVPLDQEVIIEAEDGKSDEKHHWSVVFTSFTQEQATLIRRAGFRWIEDLVEGTNQFVRYQTHREGQFKKKILEGDHVTLQFAVYSSEEFKKLAMGVRQGEKVSLIIGKRNDWMWIRTAIGDMTLGEIRRVCLPSSIAGEANQWLAGTNEPSIFLEMELVRLENQ